MASFDALPAEIILHIHLLSTSSTLPHVSRYVHSCIRSSSTPSYRARWLLLRLAREGYAPSLSTSTTSSATASSLSSSSIGRSSSTAFTSRTARHTRVNHDNTELPEDLNKKAGRRSTKDADAAFLNKALKYPICNLDTIRILEAKCLDALHARLQDKFKKEKLIKIAKIKQNNRSSFALTRAEVENKIKQEKEDVPVLPRFLPLTPRFIEIPKRLFRNLLSTPTPPNSSSIARHASASDNATSRDASMKDLFDTEDLPFIKHLITQVQANPNSSRGYPLAKAVLARHFSLISMLLDNGADPSVKDYMAVMLAVGRGDLEIVKLLIERHDDDTSYGPNSQGSSTSRGGYGEERSLGKKRKRREGGYSSPKKRKLEARCAVTSDMLELAVKQGFEPLIQFFMSKGAVPSLKTLQMLHHT